MVIALSVIGGFIVVLAIFSIYTVKQQTFAVIERFGRFSRVTAPGLHFRIPIVEIISGRVSIRVNELNVNIRTKTNDNVFVDLLIAVQYFVDGKDKVWDAFYKLTNPQQQMESWVFDTVRAKVPTMILDDVFEKKEEIATDVEESLTDRLQQYGYSLVRALVNDIQPDTGVADAMNQINRQQRLRVAAEHEGEAKKIIVVKEAEADADSKRLSGEGIADQRTAIVEGLRESVSKTSKALGVDPAAVMTLVLMTQYYDMLTEVGKNSKTNTIMLPHTPGAVGSIQEQIISSLEASKKVGTEE
ncbi:MAG: SPFH domain-containing protein [Dehalococcoidales bacterium]|nr:MAG: SPFH domain-containing protein [Dehalococcoidales bacterium]